MFSQGDRRIRIGISVVTLALLAGACGSGTTTQKAATIDPTTTSTAPAPPTTVTTPKVVRNVTEADLRQALLTVDDLPSGYSADTSSSDGEEDGDGFCKPVDKTGQQTEVEVGYVKSLFGPYVAESLAGFATDDNAHGYVASLKSVLNACQSFDETDDDGKVTHTTVAPLSFDKFGDETVAARLTVTSEMGPAVFDTIVIRSGRTILFLANGGFGGVTEDTEKLVTKAVSKLEALGG